MTTEELADLERKDPEQYARMLTRSYDILSNAGAHYVIDGQRERTHNTIRTSGPLV